MRQKRNAFFFFVNCCRLYATVKLVSWYSTVKLNGMRFFMYFFICFCVWSRGAAGEKDLHFSFGDVKMTKKNVVYFCWFVQINCVFHVFLLSYSVKIMFGMKYWQFWDEKNKNWKVWCNFLKEMLPNFCVRR